jgi:hypothetical protein
MIFLAYDLSLELIRALVQPTAAVRRRAKGWLGDEVPARGIAHRLGGMLYRLAGR